MIRGLYSSRLINCLPTSGFHQKYPSTLVYNQNVAITPLIIDFYYIFKLNIYLQAYIVLYKIVKIDIKYPSTISENLEYLSNRILVLI